MVHCQQDEIYTNHCFKKKGRIPLTCSATGKAQTRAQPPLWMYNQPTWNAGSHQWVASLFNSHLAFGDSSCILCSRHPCATSGLHDAVSLRLLQDNSATVKGHGRKKIVIYSFTNPEQGRARGCRREKPRKREFFFFFKEKRKSPHY